MDFRWLEGNSSVALSTFSQSCVPPVPEGMSTNIPPLITEWETYSQGDMTWEGLEALFDDCNVWMKYIFIVAHLSKDGG